MADPAAELLAKDKRIDDLIATSEKLVADLNDTVTDMKAVLAAGRETGREGRPHGSG